MAETPYTEADIAALKAAIAQGATKVRFGDREVTYMSLKEMREVLATMRAEVAGPAARRRTRQVRFVTGKGLA